MIRFDSVTKRYADGTVAVSGLSLEAASGEITVLVGPSGSGKTTTLRMINRLTDPTSGRIWLDDRDIASIRPPELRRGMGYVIQQAGLFPHKTVIDNIATVPLLLGQRKRRARARALDLLERVGLPAASRRPSAGPAGRLACQPVPVELPAAGLAGRRAVHDPVVGAVPRAARHLGHQDPRHGERRGRADC